ncbi:hypothetical protein DFJ74DRAFT_702575 [Hyaloraphidium curvatum]|nr:hypothetical protein DFJ74DRAFT_702575 [Hyaloraphidium curvatum]
MAPLLLAIAAAATLPLLALPGPASAFQALPVNSSQYVLAGGLSVGRIYTGLAGARGLTKDPLSDGILVLARDTRTVACLFANRTDPVLAVNFTGLDPAPNHGIAVDPSRGHIYISSPDAVYRYPWQGCTGSLPISSPPVRVVYGIPPNGHFTRTLEIDPGLQTFLYLSVGSYGNLVAGPNRSILYRYPLSAVANITDSSSALPFPQGAEVVATGLRNSVGVRFGPGGIWTVENGADDLERADIGGDIHVDNPGEEINIVPLPNGTKVPDYGFPGCFSEFILPAPYTGFRGQQWSISGPESTASAAADAACRDPSRNVPPIYLLPPHVAPLDVAIADSAAGKFQPGDVLVSARGSWNRPQPQGYALYLIRGLAATPMAQRARYELLFGEANVAGCTSSANRNRCLRPVGVVLDKEGGVWVSMDSVGQVVRLVPDAGAAGIQAVQSGEGWIQNSSSVVTTTRPSGAGRGGVCLIAAVGAIAGALAAALL